MVNPMITLNWMVKNNPEILVDNMDLPDGMDKDAMEMYILQYAGENEVRYTDSVILQKFVSIWFRANKKQFSRIWDTINAEYNPIENYDRHEVSERNTSGNETREDNAKSNSSSNTSSSSSSTADGTDSGQESGTNNVDKFVSAFDSTSLQPRESEEGNDSRNTSGTTHSESSGTSSGESSGEQNVESNGKTDRTGNELYTNYTHGNIGVTTSQAMIKEERDIADFDIYYYIAMKFEDEFTIPIYGRSCILNGILR